MSLQLSFEPRQVRTLEGETAAGARFSGAAVEWVYTSAAFLFADGAVQIGRSQSHLDANQSFGGAT
jgi:hypothetical protein